MARRQLSQDMDPEKIHNAWATRTGAYSPADYAARGPNEVTQILVKTIAHYYDETAAILALGCGAGRHLETLRQEGFTQLTGVDINEDAFEVLAEQYPTLAEVGTFHAGAIEELLPTMETNAFDVIYSVETLQHIPESETAVFTELPRITRDLLITAENEGNGPTRGTSDYTYVDDGVPLYYRDWKEIFTELGLAQLVREPTERDTVRVFRAP